jgi:anti-anti-sigma factor
MSGEKVQMTTEMVNRQTGIIHINGEVNAFAENILMDAYTEATSKGARNLVLDFSDLEYMNSSGIGLLVTLLIRANRQKQRLVAYGLTEHYRQIFELTRLNEAITIFPSQEEALAAVN